MVRNSDCYARTLNECEELISEEHIISEALLDKTITCNFHNKEQTFTREEFTLPILCKKHNHYFHKIESHIVQFHRKLVDSLSMFEAIRNHTKQELDSMVYNKELKMPYKISVNGWFLEKWLLKTAINYAFMMDETRRPRFNFEYLNKRLFADEKLEFPYGLSVLRPPEQTNDKYSGGIFFDYAEDSKGIYTIVINLQGYIFLMLLPSDDTEKIIKDGFLWEGNVYKFDESIFYHSLGENQQVMTSDNIPFTRTKLTFEWK